MGEMADFTNDGMMDDYEAYWDFREGRLSQYEAYDMGIIDEFGAVIGNPASIPSDPLLDKKKKKRKNK